MADFGPDRHHIAPARRRDLSALASAPLAGSVADSKAVESSRDSGIADFSIGDTNHDRGIRFIPVVRFTVTHQPANGHRPP